MFKPIINITKISKQSDYFEIIDVTTNAPNNPTGWGVAYGPANSGAILDVILFTQYLGTEPQQQTKLTGNIFTGLKVTQSLSDGVYAINPLYGVGFGMTIVSGMGSTILKTSLDGVAFANLMDGITHIKGATTLFKIKSIDVPNGIIELYDIYNDGTNIIRYFGTSITMMLVTNCGEKLLLERIANYSLTEDGCNSEYVKNTMEMMVLKQSAIVAFNCKDYSKAHKAATLLCNNSQSTPCTHC